MTAWQERRERMNGIQVRKSDTADRRDRYKALFEESSISQVTLVKIDEELTELVKVSLDPREKQDLMEILLGYRRQVVDFIDPA